jgi:hypothetical protein
VALAAAGCGGGDRQDKNEPKGTFPVQVVKASFPKSQHLAQKTRLLIQVRNTGKQAVPNIGVTITSAQGAKASVDAFARVDEQYGLADPARPVWIMDEPPHGAATAYTNTWAAGRLAPGAVKTFVWGLTAVRPGSWKVGFRVNAGLDGRAKASGPGGRIPSGSFAVHVSGKPPHSRVDDNGNVVRDYSD